MAKKKGIDPLIIGGAALVGFLLWKRKAKAAEPVFEEPDPEFDDPDVDEPDQPVVPSLPQVDPTGIPSTVMGGVPGIKPGPPMPSYQAVVTALTHLGYGAGRQWQGNASRIIMKLDGVKRAIRNFQREFKFAALYINTMHPPTLSGAAVPDPPRKKLGVDGWIGYQSWPALKWAYRYSFLDGKTWAEWVILGKGLVQE